MTNNVICTKKEKTQQPHTPGRIVDEKRCDLAL